MRSSQLENSFINGPSPQEIDTGKDGNLRPDLHSNFQRKFSKYVNEWKTDSFLMIAR
jgi:hypothetical protein